MEQSVRFMHIRKHDSKGNLKATEGATIAVKAEGERYHVYAAFCSKRDVFCRRIGRAVAEGRLNHYLTNKEIPAVNEQLLRTAVERLCQKNRQEFSEKAFDFLINRKNHGTTQSPTA